MTLAMLLHLSTVCRDRASSHLGRFSCGTPLGPRVGVPE